MTLIDASVEPALRVAGAGDRPGGPGAERRILDAAARCVARWGVSKTTLEDVAAEAGCSRATVYRLFPGGRDRLLDAMVESELGRFFDGLAAAVAPVASDLEELLVVGIVASARAILGHDALQFVLAHEPEIVLPQVSFAAMDAVLALVGGVVAPWLEPHVGASDAPRAAEWLARIVISYTASPAADLDATDVESVRRLVRSFVLPGLTAVGGARTPTRP
ncbi:MAG: TetR/AcrR family transcriptional regulator [Acidimicrobiales bacterium]